MIHILFGASGTGKGLFCKVIREMTQRGKKISLHVKGTTRQLSEYDGDELTNHHTSNNGSKEKLTEENIHNYYDYVYSKTGEDYFFGIQQDQIDRAINNNEPHFIICNDFRTIKKIRERNSMRTHTRLLYLLYNASKVEIKQQIEERIKEEASVCCDSLEMNEIVEARYARISKLHEAFTTNAHMFDGVIFNKYNSGADLSQSYKNLRKQIQFEINDCENCFLTFKPKTVFVIKPMRAVYADHPDFFDKTRDIIKKVCDDHGLEYINYSQKSGQSAINDIHEGIAHAEYIIADISGNLPNCYYEFGIASKLEKKIILIRDKKSDNPEFDLYHLHALPYDLSDLESVIGNEIKYYQSERKRHE